MPSKYEDDAEPVVGAAQLVLDGVFEDLDEERGGTSWMHGHMDVARICLVTDYLISSARGVQEAAIATTFALEQYHAARTSDHFALKQRLRAAEQAGLPQVAALAPRDLQGRTKALRVRLELERSVFHLGQLLDRLAACVVVAGGLSIDLLPVSWSTIHKRAINGLPAKTGLADPQSASGRERQARVLALVRTHFKKSPDAFDWLWQYRNTVIHRSEMISWIMQAQLGKHDFKLVSPLPRQPDWAFHEAMIEERDSLDGLIILKDPADVLDGLWLLVESLTIAVLEELSALWIERRQAPDLIIQPGSQWPNLGARKTYAFEGFGEPLNVATISSVLVAPSEARRIKAAKVLEADSDVWSDQ